MNRKSSFLIVLLSAAITIGTLFATVGKPPYMRHHSHHQDCHKTEMEQAPQQK